MCSFGYNTNSNTVDVAGIKYTWKQILIGENIELLNSSLNDDMNEV